MQDAFPFTSSDRRILGIAQGVSLNDTILAVHEDIAIVEQTRHESPGLIIKNLCFIGSLLHLQIPTSGFDLTFMMATSEAFCPSSSKLILP